MAQKWGSRLLQFLRGRTPAEHFDHLSRRLDQLEEKEREAKAELRRLRSSWGNRKPIARAERRLDRLGRRADRVRRLMAKARPFVPRDH